MPEHRPIVIESYRPDWAGMFQEERERIADALGESAVAIEHIGSTAVAGLAAKPIIDMLVEVKTLDDAPRLIAALEALGYTYVPEHEAQLPTRRFLRRDTDGARSHHIHLYARGDPDIARHLHFRDHLVAHPEIAREYAALKRELAARLVDDMEAYCEAKTAFIRRVESSAQE